MGASGGIPDIGVRLSAQGVQDVVNAFARVRQEGKKTGTETSASLELINGALATMEELLPAISFAIAIDKLVEIGVSASESAENLGKLSEKTGAAVGTLSALNLAAHDVGVTQESLGNGLVKLAKNQEDATNGSKKQVKAFGDLGITLKNLKTQDPGQLFVTVAEKMAALPDGAEKANVAIALFGKAGAELIPMLKSLGVDGFDAAVEKAKKLGLFLSTDMVASARAAQDALHEIGDIANGVGTQFVSGFVPQFTQGIENFTEAIEGQGVDSIEKFGEAAGTVFKAIVESILIIGAAWKTMFKTAAEDMSYEFGQAKAGLLGLAQGGVSGAVAGVMGYNAQNGEAHNSNLQQIGDSFHGSLASAWSQFRTPPTRTASTPDHPGGGGSGNGLDPKEQAKQDEAQSAFLQAQADNELAILKLKNQLEEAEDQRSYNAGTLSLDEYYDRREARITAEAAKELEVLQKKQKAVADLPAKTPEQGYKKDQAAAAVQTQITETQLKEQGDLKAVEQDRAKAKHDAAIAELNDIEKLQKASGDKYGAEETQLEIELQQYADLLQKQGKSVDEINAAVDAYRLRGQALIEFGRNQEDGSSAMTSMNLGISDIQNQAANGGISNIQAQAQINQLQQDSLSTLSAIGLQMFKNAALSGDPKAIDTANQYNASVQKLASSLKNVTTASVELTNQLATQGYSDLVEFFTAGISGAKSFGDAMTDLGNQFASIVGKMVAQLIVFEVLESILGWIAPGSSALTNLKSAGPFGSSPLTGHASGGYTGDGPVNKIAGFVHGQEYVIKAGPAKEYLPFLEAINNGQMPSVTPATQGAAHVSSYMAELTAGGGSPVSDLPAPVINVTNTTGQPSSQKQSTGSGGASITDIIIGSVAADIAKGGKVAQTLQTSYGVSRTGVRRG